MGADILWRDDEAWKKYRACTGLVDIQRNAVDAWSSLCALNKNIKNYLDIGRPRKAEINAYKWGAVVFFLKFDRPTFWPYFSARKATGPYIL